MRGLYFFTLFFGYYLSEVKAIGQILFCPKFRNGINTVDFTVNKTAVEEAICSSATKYVTFDKTQNSNTVTICYTPAFNSSSCHPVQNPTTPNSCWCQETNGEMFRYQLAYLGNQSRDVGAKLEGTVCAHPSKPFDSRTDENCTTMPYDSGADKNAANNIRYSSLLMLMMLIYVIAHVLNW